MNQGNNSALASMEFKQVSKYVVEKRTEVEKLSSKVEDMGFLGLLWDSKIPEKDETFYYFFSLKSSNKAAVLREIRKYQDFYEELGKAVDKINKSEKMTDKNAMIKDLKEKLSQMDKAAKRGENDSDSSTVCHLHRSFIQKHEKLEHMIKQVECVALKDGLEKAQDRWTKSLQKIDKLEKKLDDIIEIYENEKKEKKDEFDSLKQQNELLQKNHTELIKSNRQMEQLIETHEERAENRDKERKLEIDTLKQQNELLQKNHNELIKSNTHMEQLIETHEERAENGDKERKHEIDTLKEKNELLLENRNELTENNRKLSRLIEVLLEENIEIKTMLRRISEPIST